MKTVKTIAQTFFIAASLLLLNSCNKDDDNPTPFPVVPANTSFITAKVNGANFTTLLFGTSTASCSRSGTGTSAMITILGGDMSANSITIFLDGNVGVGTQTVNITTNSLLNYSPGSGDQAFSTGSCVGATGTINITASDETHIEGTFSFTGKETDDCSLSKTVTQGTFKGVFPS